MYFWGGIRKKGILPFLVDMYTRYVPVYKWSPFMVNLTKIPLLGKKIEKNRLKIVPKYGAS